jgi:cytochrome c-type biogenesis protein CcmH
VTTSFAAARTAILLLPAIFAVLLAASQPVPGTDVEREARKLEAQLIAPCCFTQQVSIHQSPAADEVRQDVRRRLAAGETPEEILDAYVAQYGKRVLAQPPAEGIGRALYLLPPLAFLATGALVVLIVWRLTKRRAAAATAAWSGTSPVEERYRAELDEQLRDLD